ncbi:protein of unknown function [Denitratisoma oestradiolicum]|uniref:Uncharacterized protein n=1 Tax=Denitratisoma oestradiolicum TaxID=311182 RepID=A0A6S6YBN8_9PROT|nr:protein of unknown function [Denitratisoma oestradiolicum]
MNQVYNGSFTVTVQLPHSCAVGLGRAGAVRRHDKIRPLFPRLSPSFSYADPDRPVTPRWPLCRQS